MRLITNPPAVPWSGGVAITDHPTNREPIAITWCRGIAAAVAAALDTEFDRATWHLTLHGHLRVPQSLYAAFGIAGHHVQVTVVWDSPWREPGFARTVDTRPVIADTAGSARPAVVLAHAAWQTITDAGYAGTSPRPDVGAPARPVVTR